MKNSTWATIGVGIAGTFAIGKIVAKRHEEEESIDDDNEYLKSAHTDSLSTVFVDNSATEAGERLKVVHMATKYEAVVKPALDSILSFAGLALLSPLYGVISLAVYLDDPGPIFFTQKRVGKDKHFFCLHKFRTMKMSTPHDVPTHQLVNPEGYITRVGRVLRRTSLDELPQVWDIWRGKMSVIGPRPALWNQADLVECREQYGANSVLPGLTGWAQINGRDELEIPVKASLDGEYVKRMSFLFDLKCFLGTIRSVASHDGVVEGGTGEMHKREQETYPEDQYRVKGGYPLRPGVPEIDPPVDWGFKKKFDIDKNHSVRVLVTGAGSYIGESFREYASVHYPNIDVTAIDMIDGSWRSYDFSGFDCVFHVAGIAHADVGEASEEEIERYYSINTDLALETARKAEREGVKQFIFMSSMIIYGGKEYVDEKTIPSPLNFYGDSKWQADRGLRAMESEGFNVAILRPPMIYGKGSKGNYPTLSKLAKRVPVFPAVDNKRSLLYIENLCEFVALLTLSGRGGVFVPQNSTYSDTSDLVRTIADSVWHPIHISKVFSHAVFIADHIPGKIKNLSTKAFGSSYYDQELSTYTGLDYQKYDMKTSIERTEAT